MQEIIIDIDNQGNARIEGKGIDGSDCKALTEEVEKAIGVVRKTTTKPEYHRNRSVGITKRVS